MAVYFNVLLDRGFAVERNHCDRGIIPAGNISACSLSGFEHDDAVGINVLVGLSLVM